MNDVTIDVERRAPDPYSLDGHVRVGRLRHGHRWKRAGAIFRRVKGSYHG